jgi:hypothetical protein
MPPICSPQRLSRALALVAPLVLALGSSTTAHAGKVCEVPSGSGPVALVILASGAKVHAYARTLKGTVAHRDAETVIFHDGRVVTSDIEAAGRHLNDLGWGGRGINVMASFPAPRARRSGGWG